MPRKATQATTAFDLAIIGGGAGAFAAVIRANELGAKTVMVNSGLPFGGTCVNVGCVPSKTLLWAGEVLHHSKEHGIPGIALEVTHFDFLKVVQDELALVERLQKEKYEKVLQSLQHVQFIEGKAVFTSPHEIEVNGQRLSAEKFLIAAGSTATVPPIENIREVGYLTHVEALKLEKQPEDLIVVGAGPLGLEFAQMYARFGTKVTILQKGPSIFPPTEKELTGRLAEALQREGITIHTSVNVQRAFAENGRKGLIFDIEGKEGKVLGEEILLATGKTPSNRFGYRFVSVHRAWRNRLPRRRYALIPKSRITRCARFLLTFRAKATRRYPYPGCSRRRVSIRIFNAQSFGAWRET